MKSLKIVLIASMLCISICTVFAQYGNTGKLEIGVMSLRIGGVYTKAQVEEAMGGAPTKYEAWNNEFGLGEEYNYNSNILRFRETGIFVDFLIATNQYPIYVQYDGGIKVGDNISKFSQLGIGTPVRQPNGEYKVGRGDDPLIVTVDSNNIIKELYYTFPN